MVAEANISEVKGAGGPAEDGNWADSSRRFARNTSCCCNLERGRLRCRHACGEDLPVLWGYVDLRERGDERDWGLT